MQNRAGKTRLAKYYIPMDDKEKHALEYEVHKLIANRDPKFTNFVEVRKARQQSLICMHINYCLSRLFPLSALANPCPPPQPVILCGCSCVCQVTGQTLERSHAER